METPQTIKRLSKHQRNALSVKPSRLLKIKVSMKARHHHHVTLVERKYGSMIFHTTTIVGAVILTV